MQRDKILKNPVLSTVLIFAALMAVHTFETLVLRTDETVLAENVYTKIIGVAALFYLLKTMFWTWEEIGFDLDEMGEGLKKGLKIAVLCFTFAYCIELLYLSARGSMPRFKVFAGSFSLTGEGIQTAGFKAIALCVLFNIINVWMEEGTFRGFFMNLLQTKYRFLIAALISAVLFGIWHFPLPIRSYIDGEWGPGQTALMCLGYFVLAGLMGIKWSMMREMDGNIWQAAGDHMFNNLVVTNLLHIVTDTGVDEFLIARVAIGQILSFLMVLVLYRKKDQPAVERPRRFRRPPLISQAEKVQKEAKTQKKGKRKK